MNKFIKVFLRLIIFVFAIFALLFIVDKTIYFKNKIKNKDVVDYNVDLINKMIDDKYKFPSYNINNLGSNILIKSDEIIPSKEKDIKRILIVGDSNIWGYGNSNLNTTTQNRLKLLLKQEGYNNVEVYAVAAPGLALVDEMYKLIENNPMYKKINPDLVIYCMVENDFETALYDQGEETPMPFFDSKLYLENNYNNKFYQIFKKIFPNLFNTITEKRMKIDSLDDKWVLENGEIYGSDVDYHLVHAIEDPAYVKSFKDYGLTTLKNLKADKFIFRIYGCYVWNQDFYDIAIKYINEAGIKYYDKRDEFFDIADTDDLLKYTVPGDAHPSELLNDIYAKQILEILKEDYPKILGKKTKKVKPVLNINDTMPSNIYLEKINNKEYRFVYPTGSLLTYPVGEEFVKLNLEMPVNIKSLEIISESDNISSSQVWINHINDDHNYIQIYQNDDDIFEINDEVFSLNINIKFDRGEYSDHQVILKFK